MTLKNFQLAKWYTRIIAILFLLVFFSFLFDYFTFGFRLETGHKLFHVLIGGIILAVGWSNSRFWLFFPLVNGLFFIGVATWGFIFPNFLGLAAFNFTDTILHSIVGITGVGVSLGFERWIS